MRSTPPPPEASFLRSFTALKRAVKAGGVFLLIPYLHCMDLLQQQFQYYLGNQENIVKAHEGKIVVISGLKVVASTDSQESAYNFVVNTGILGKAIIQKVSEGDKDYTMRFSGNNVIFTEPAY